MEEVVVVEVEVMDADLVAVIVARRSVGLVRVTRVWEEVLTPFFQP